MSRTGENIHKRKDGRWEARVIISNEYGKKKHISVYAKSYREVKAKKIEIQTTQIRSCKSNKMQLKDVIEEWRANNALTHKGATALKYETMIDRHILPVLGTVNIKNMDESVINAFLAEKTERGRLDGKGGLSNSYVKTLGIILSSVMNYATAKKYCDPMVTKISKPAAEKKEIAVLDREEQIELEKILVCDGSLTSLGILITLNTGLRIGEICGLKWSDIDLENRVLHVRRTVARVISPEPTAKTHLILDKPKTKSSIRDIPITSKLFKILEGMKAATTSEYVVSKQKSFVSPRTFDYRFHKILEYNGVPKINYHCLRHTFATRCVELSVDVKSLSEILGHANVGTTLNTYVHPSFDIKRLQLEKLSELEKQASGS